MASAALGMTPLHTRACDRRRAGRSGPRGPEAMTTAPSQSSCEKATPVSRSQRSASKVTKPPACPQMMIWRSFRDASARVRRRGGVSSGPSRMTSRLPSTRIAGPVPLTTTIPFLMTV